MTDRIPTPEQFLADQAAERAVQRMMQHLGFDVSHPIRTQEQMASLRRLAARLDDEEFQEDFAFLRRLRMTSEKVSSSTISTIVKIMVTAFLALLALGTKDWWFRHISN